MRHCYPGLLLLFGLMTMPVHLFGVIFDPTANVVTAGLDGAQAVDVGDIDGDGDLDTVAAGGDGGTVIWLAQGPNATWTPTVIDDALPGAVALAVADLDKDGDLDVVAASNTADTLRWYENTAGDGTSWTAQDVTTTEDGVRSIGLADLDSDGDVDIVTAAEDADRIVWWANDDGDSFAGAPTVIVNAFDGAYDLTIADVDRNGRADVVGVARLAELVAVFYNASPDGSTWLAETVSNGLFAPTAVVTFDFYGVGRVNVAAAGGPHGTVAFWGQTMDGAWAGAGSYPGTAPATDLAVADMEGDGDPDLVRSASGTVVTLEWIVNAYSGLGFGYAVGSLAEPAALALGDLDDDGDLEVLVAAPGTDTVASFDNRAPHLKPAYPDGIDFTEPVQLALTTVPADLNGDGRVDIVGVAFDHGELAWWSPPATAGGPWTKTSISTTQSDPMTVDAADLDGDGDVDVLLGSALPGRIAWFENAAGDGETWVEHVIDDTIESARPFVGDLDGDGDLDVVALAATSPRVAWWENVSGDGSTWTQTVIDDTLDLPVHADVADINGDGRLDMVVADSGGDQLVAYESNGLAEVSWSRFEIETGFLDPRWIQAGDIDGDGDLDVAATSIQLGLVWWFANPKNGGGGWNGTEIGSVFGALRSDLGDPDGDGDLDIVVPYLDPDDVRLYENVTGDGMQWAESSIDDNFDGAVEARFVDIDQDGRLDLVGAANNYAPLRWWPNRGGTLAPTALDTAPAAMAIEVFDDVLAIDVVHQGVPGDVPIELRSMMVRFEASPGDPLDSTEANALFERVDLVRDHPTDGVPGVFDPADRGAGTVFPLLLDDEGNAFVHMHCGEPTIQVAVGEPARFFFVTLLEPEAVNATPNHFQVTFLGTTPKAVLIGTDLPTSVAFAPDVSSQQVTADLDEDGDGVADSIDLCFGANGTGDSDQDGICADLDVDDDNPNVGLPLFRDTFESGDTSAWSITVP